MTAEHVGEQRGRAPGAVEMPTVLVAIAVYGCWLMVTAWFHAMPLSARMLAGGWLVAWHGSLQHEIIHGHPTRWRTVNTVLGAVPLSLWLPFRSYRRTHLDHHDAAIVTDPFEDPESWYLAERGGARAAIRRAFARIRSTLLGRLTLGPAIVMADFLVGEAVDLRRRPARVLGDWTPHLIGIVVVVAWLRHCHVDLASYVACFVYPGTALTLLRSFAEHRAAPVAAERVAIVERAGPLALLYLNNNLHAAHHEKPGLPWYRLPAYHRRHRARLIGANGGLVYEGYGDVVRRYLFRPYDALLHPDRRVVPLAA